MKVTEKVIQIIPEAGEGMRHARAKARIANLYFEAGWDIEIEANLGAYRNGDTNNYPFRGDIVAENKRLGKRVIVEIDGRIGHNSKRAFTMDKARFKSVEWAFVPTGEISQLCFKRFSMSWINDKNITDDDLKADLLITPLHGKKEKRKG